MLSESARMNSPAESRFRLQAPNSKPRAIKVIALDSQSERVITRLAEQPWNHATFLTAAEFPGAVQMSEGVSADGWLRDLEGGARDLAHEVETADLVVMVASPGGQAHAASLIGEACSSKRVMTTGLFAGAKTASDAAMAKTLAQLRPWSLMVVIAHNDEYIQDMLTALRA